MGENGEELQMMMKVVGGVKEIWVLVTSRSEMLSAGMLGLKEASGVEYVRSRGWREGDCPGRDVLGEC